MFPRFLFPIITAILCVYFATHTISAADEDNGKQNTTVQTEKNVNDSIIEFFNNCTCVPFYHCNVANKYLYAARANILPIELKCTDEYFTCCKNTTAEPVTPEPATEPSVTPSTSTNITTTTEIPSVRNFGDNEKSCGIATTEISVRILTTDIESATTIPGEIPWMVEIFQKQSNPKRPYRFKCAGTLIHEKVVLTATHCVVSNKPPSLKIVATGGEVFQNVGTDPEDERNVAEIIKHPDFYSGGLYNDIALIILDKEYNFSMNFLNSICVPQANQNFTGRKCLAAGWGKNVDLESIPLRKVDVPVVDFEQCQTLLRKTSLGNEFNLDSSFLCAGGEEGKDTCNGDGGGPLICLGQEYQFVQAGIVSWGVQNTCGVANQPGMYADVRKFREWITDTLSKREITVT